MRRSETNKFLFVFESGNKYPSISLTSILFGAFT